MDRNNKNSPQLGYPVDDVGDLKYVSGLSTILVATIQEAKDRISQIEYIFCNQLFANFQSKSKTLQKIYNDARKAAEDAWKIKESDLVLQIERLQLENKMVIEENRSLKLENAKFLSSLESLLQPLETNSNFVGNSEKKLKELEEKNVILQKERTSDIEGQTIRGESMKKSKEAGEGMEQQNRLLQLVQSKASLVLQKDKQLAGHEEMKKELLFQIECLEKNARTVQEQLREKSNEVKKEKMLHEKLVTDNNLYVSKNLNSRQFLDECEKKKKLLTGKAESLDVSVNELQWKVKHKNEEVEECRKLHEQYLEKIDRDTKELLKTAQQVEKLEKENFLLVDNQIGLQEKIDKLEAFLRQRANETSEGLELHGKLLQQIEEKNSELQSEKNKRRDLIAVHKNLKSQYNFLLAKFSLTTECSNPPNEMKNERKSSRLGQSPHTSPDNGIKALVQGSNCELASSSKSPALPMEPINTRSGLLAGTKRSLSSWRDTRSNQKQGGFDPHDDFLDTPLENIIGKIKKPSKDEQVVDIPDRAPKDINFDCSDGEETQDLGGELASKKPAPGPGGKSGFKYIEPVRKRAERENLKGIECKQCRKFYDAVHPDGGDKNNTDLRCEHHEGVSRHRYRFAPPSTPEGFWNIGFESEM